MHSADLILPCFSYHHRHVTRGFLTRAKKVETIEVDGHSQQAVTTALWCNFLVFSLKFGVWLSTASHVMLAEVVHSAADFTNQALLAYGLSSSRRAPDALHLSIPYYRVGIMNRLKEKIGATLVVAIHAVRKGAAAEEMKVRDYIWRGHDPTDVAFMTESNSKNMSCGDIPENTKCKMLHWCGDRVVAEGRIASTDPKIKVHHVPLA